MKITRATVALALCAGMVFGIGASDAAIIQTQAKVEPGVWTSDFNGALAYADQNNIPVMVFWGNDGCHNCEKVERAMNDDQFVSWMKDRQILMVFSLSNPTVKTWIKDNATEKIRDFPYVGVYWPSNTKGEKVLIGFSGYKGKMGNYGADSNDSNVEQLMTAVDYILSDWDPSGEKPIVNPDPVKPDPVNPDPVKPDPVNPDPVKPDPVDPAKIYNKSRTIEAIAYKEGSLFGKSKVTIGKYSSRKSNVKVSVKLSTFAGKTYTKTVYANPDKDGNLSEFQVPFTSTIGPMTFNVTNNGGEFLVNGSNDEFSVEPGSIVIGGKLEAEEMTLAVDFSDEPELAGYDFIVGAPSFAIATVKNGTSLKFGASSKPKYVLYREDGDRWYELEYDDERYPNANAVKITYKPGSGAFSGSFKMYASNEGYVDGKKPTIKTFTGKINGYVVDGAGVGSVSVKVGKKTYTGTCTLD